MSTIIIIHPRPPSLSTSVTPPANQTDTFDDSTLEEARSLIDELIKVRDAQ